jgi:phage baseplate assembly protein W
MLDDKCSVNSNMGQYKEITIKSNRSEINTIPKSQIYRGVSTINENSKSFALYDAELIKQDILNHFNIKKGEKIYNPDFGSVIWSMIHEPLTESTRDTIMNDIKTVIGSDPRVNLRAIDVIEREYGMQIALELEYVATSQIEKMVYSFDRNSGMTTT